MWLKFGTVPLEPVCLWVPVLAYSIGWRSELRSSVAVALGVGSWWRPLLRWAKAGACPGLNHKLRRITRFAAGQAQGGRAGIG